MKVSFKLGGSLDIKDYISFLGPEVFPIFLFHGVIVDNDEPVRNYNRKHIGAEYFETILRSLVEAGGHPVSMDDILKAKVNASILPTGAFAVTFDDGFENNYSVALPILEQLEVPATIYITSKFIDENLMSWIDRIEWALVQTDASEIDLPWNKLAPIATPLEKIVALEDIRNTVKTSSNINPDELATNIQESLCGKKVTSLNDTLNRKLSWQQVSQLASNNLISIGGHTHTHQILAHLDEPRLDYEVTTPISMIEEYTSAPVIHFSYPEGLSHHFSSRCIEKLQSRGVLICPTAICGVNDATTDLFYLRRISVT